MASDNLMSAVFPSAASPARAFRFACDERPASEANDVSACDERVVYGAFIPSQNPRAGPPRDALLSRCFLVTSLHQQRSDPLAQRPSGSSGLESHQDPAWPSGSSVLVSRLRHLLPPAGEGAPAEVRRQSGPAINPIHPHLLYPQFRHVAQPSIRMTAWVWHLWHIVAPGGKALGAGGSGSSALRADSPIAPARSPEMPAAASPRGLISGFFFASSLAARAS